MCIAHLKRNGTRAETRFRLSPKRTSQFNSAGVSVQPTAGNPVVSISVSNAGYTMFRGSVRVLATHSIRNFPLHFPSLASPCVIRFQTHSSYTWLWAPKRKVHEVYGEKFCTDSWPLTTEIVAMNFKMCIYLHPVWLSWLLWALKSIVVGFYDCLIFFFLQFCGLQSNWLIRSIFNFWGNEIFYANF